MSKGWERPAFVVWRRDDWEGILSMHTNILRMVSRGQGQMGQWAQTRTQEAPSEYEEKHLYCGSDISLEQAPEQLQSPFLEILKTHLDTSCATSSGWICLSGRVGLDDLLSPSLPILWFCEIALRSWFLFCEPYIIANGVFSFYEVWILTSYSKGTHYSPKLFSHNLKRTSQITSCYKGQSAGDRRLTCSQFPKSLSVFCSLM